MADGQIVRQEQGGPLCPQDDGGNALHRLRVKAVDALYEQLPKDEDGEFSLDDDILYRSATKPLDNHMNLYVVRSSGAYLGRQRVVEAWYFRCPICGFVLPAVGIDV